MDRDAPPLDIAEVARRSGLPASTLRYYEARGLIAAAGRRRLRRVFRADVLERLALIALGRAAGFSLDEIAGMLVPQGRPRIDRQRLADRAQALDGLIERLCAVRDGLRHAAACPAAHHLECPSFRRLLRAAAAGALAPPGDGTPPGTASLSATSARSGRRRAGTARTA